MNLNFSNETLYPNSHRPNVEKLPDIIKEFLNIKNEVHLIYNLVYGFLLKNNSLLKSNGLNNGQFADFGYLCRELENIFDELRKEVKTRKELCGNRIAYNLTQASLTDPTKEMKARGELAIATPDVKMQAALPKKFSDEYYALTDHFNIPRHIAESGVVKLDWKSMVNHCTKLFNEGKNLPEGLGKQYPLYFAIFRKNTKKS